MILDEEKFFEVLVHIMWELEVDIFTAPQKTLAMAADYAPRCKKQYNRLKVMYDCGSMDKIEKAVEIMQKGGDCEDEYAEYMWEAVDLLAKGLATDEEKAVFAVNQIIALWDGELPELEASQDDDAVFDEDEEGDEMLFLQDVTEEENGGEEENTQPAEESSDGGSDDGEKDSILKKIVHSWCMSPCEEGRPLIVACPIGWLWILICAFLGVFMIYDVSLGDKLTPPVFVFMFILLICKRHYRFESAGRLSIAVGLFYVIAAFRALWLGSGTTVRCLYIIAPALIVFNSGRIAALLDGEKRRTGTAYLLIFLFSAATAAGVYALQNMQF